MSEPPLDRRRVSDPSLLFAERDPFPILNAGVALKGPVRDELPQLCRVSAFSNYVDESLWLGPHLACELSADFDALVAVAEFSEFSLSVSGAHVRAFWSSWPDDVHDFGDLLRLGAREQCWIHFML